jgi:hypothetical protein
MARLTENSLVHIGSNQTNYLQVFNKRKRTRWDDNPRPYTRNVGSRKTRWGFASEKYFTPLPFTSIPEGVDFDAFEILIRKYRLDDVNRRIQCNDFENFDPDLRSPSPEPIYDSKGVRLNVREIRTKEKYIKEKNSLIEELISIDVQYRPPYDYKPPKKVHKIYISEIENEKHKLVALILGVGGSTQRELEKKSGCKISVRGKGSNWKSNINSDFSVYDENEPLHVRVESDKEELMIKAVSLIEPILDPYSEQHTYCKNMQKQAIDLKYGYQTDPACENCGERHKTWACPLNIGQFEADVKCDICQDRSHPTVDCPQKVRLEDTEIETELSKFLKEIDEFKKQADIPVLKAEYKPDDIRNSVLYTGKVSEEKSEIINKVENTSRQIKEEKVQQNINIAVPPSYLNQPQVRMPVNNGINYNVNNPFYNTTENYRLPVAPIVNNPNVIRASPVNYMNPNQYLMNQQMGYFNQFSPLFTQQHNAFSRGLNLISSNFQGKIPMQYGMNINPMASYPQRSRMNELITNNINQGHNQQNNFNPQTFYPQAPKTKQNNVHQNPPEPDFPPEPTDDPKDDIEIKNTI